MVHVNPSLNFSNNRSNRDLMNKICRYLNLPATEDRVCYKQLPTPQEKRGWAKIIQMWVLDLDFSTVFLPLDEDESGAGLTLIRRWSQHSHHFPCCFRVLCSTMLTSVLKPQCQCTEWTHISLERQARFEKLLLNIFIPIQENQSLNWTYCHSHKPAAAA